MKIHIHQTKRWELEAITIVIVQVFSKKKTCGLDAFSSIDKLIYCDNKQVIHSRTLQINFKQQFRCGSSVKTKRTIGKYKTLCSIYLLHMITTQYVRIQPLPVKEKEKLGEEDKERSVFELIFFVRSFFSSLSDQCYPLSIQNTYDNRNFGRWCCRRETQMSSTTFLLPEKPVLPEKPLSPTKIGHSQPRLTREQDALRLISIRSFVVPIACQSQTLLWSANSRYCVGSDGCSHDP